MIQEIDEITKEIEKYADKIEDKTFLITGGAGFIGSWFCDTILSLNGKVICVDNFISGSKKNIEHLQRNKRFKLIKKDFCTLKFNKKVDYVIHMASIASPPLYQLHPLQTLDIGYIGTKNALSIAVKNKANFLFTSTSEVYGNPPDDQVPTKEDYYGYVNSFGERSMYDESKRVSEAMIYSFIKKYPSIKFRIARIFNTYGPRLDQDASQYGRVLIKFVQQALFNQPITVYGDGKQTRSFCYITDQIIGLSKLLLEDDLPFNIFNIGNDKETSILELARLVKELTKSKSEIILNAKPNYDIKDDPRRRCPDISRARKYLGFNPKINLNEGLKRVIEWYKKH
ncbi:MAG: NAD-dependent epimerase/dehydratase family protein [Candidatus Aenigmarchaeota archaeon]|nr:NAD-dependent epimerase/dehydratase family protein [Candidatus Aenigmarchaeota archaeon]MBU5689240.1 NAD-dependent epimerase/dehydratase family protein [Candidatus Aenigmarchaeota archaeon]